MVVALSKAFSGQKSEPSVEEMKEVLKLKAQIIGIDLMPDNIMAYMAKMPRLCFPNISISRIKEIYGKLGIEINNLFDPRKEEEYEFDEEHQVAAGIEEITPAQYIQAPGNNYTAEEYLTGHLLEEIIISLINNSVDLQDTKLIKRIIVELLVNKIDSHDHAIILPCRNKILDFKNKVITGQTATIMLDRVTLQRSQPEIMLFRLVQP